MASPNLHPPTEPIARLKWWLELLAAVATVLTLLIAVLGLI
jgi:hypothetical protein